SSVHGVLTELCDVMRVGELSAAKLSRAIGAKARGTGGLIIVDEAQHLSTAALEQLRAFPDKYAVGLALIGNEEVYARIEGGGRKPKFAQLFSRIGMRMTRSNPQAQDIHMLIDAWGVKTKEEEKLLKLIARKPSALRGMTKCLKLATLIASGQGVERTDEHIRMAWARLSPEDFKTAG
ncbi:MAG: AAA family ATPase, partial [Alphaproteobacteria bacterium]